jgi:hypothetical protein
MIAMEWEHGRSSTPPRLVNEWRQRAFLQLPGTIDGIGARPFVLVAEAFYSLVLGGTTRQVFKYDLGDHSMSIFNLPPMVADRAQQIPPAIVTAEDGGLGLAHLDKFSLHMWFYDDGVLEWTHNRVIDLSMHIPVGDPMIVLKYWAISYEPIVDFRNS